MNARIDRPLALRLIALAAVATVASVIPALVMGWLTYSVMMSGTSGDGFAELGAAVFAMVVGSAVWVIAYVAIAIIGARRIQPAGSRARAAAAVVLLPAAVLAVAPPSAVAGAYGGGLVIGVASLLLLAAAVLGVAAIGGVSPLITVARIALPLVAVAAALLVATSLVGARAEREEKREAIMRLGVLPLVDGERLDEPFTDWRLDDVRYLEHEGGIDVRWDVESPAGGDAHMKVTRGGVEVRVHTGEDWLVLEEQLRQRLVYVPAERFIEACGRRC